MTRRDDHIQHDHFQSAHSEKEEWVTPKISPLTPIDTHGKPSYPTELTETTAGPS